MTIITDTLIKIYRRGYTREGAPRIDAEFENAGRLVVSTRGTAATELMRADKGPSYRIKLDKNNRIVEALAG